MADDKKIVGRYRDCNCPARSLPVKDTIRDWIGALLADLSSRRRRSTYPQLDPGETATFVPCSERDALLLTDDLDVQDLAKEARIEVHGSIDVP